MADKSGAELISEARKRIKEISVADVLAMQARGDNAVYLDVREQNEWNLGHIPKATFLPRGVIETTVEQRVPRDASSPQRRSPKCASASSRASTMPAVP